MAVVNGYAQPLNQLLNTSSLFEKTSVCPQKSQNRNGLYRFSLHISSSDNKIEGHIQTVPDCSTGNLSLTQIQGRVIDKVALMELNLDLPGEHGKAAEAFISARNGKIFWRLLTDLNEGLHIPVSETIDVYSVSKPGARESGDLIANYANLSEQVQNSTRNDDSHISSCVPTKNATAWFLLLNDRSQKKCSIPVGATMIFPAISSLAIGANCGEIRKDILQDVGRYESVFSVYVDGNKLPTSAFWRNKSSDCFSLKTGWEQFGIIENNKQQKLSLTYADGYWIKLRFLSPGLHTVRVINLPHIWLYSTYQTDSVYSVQVERPQVEQFTSRLQ